MTVRSWTEAEETRLLEAEQIVNAYRGSHPTDVEVNAAADLFWLGLRRSNIRMTRFIEWLERN